MSQGTCPTLVLALGSMSYAWQGPETEPQLWSPMHHTSLSISTGHAQTAKSAARAFP